MVKPEWGRKRVCQSCATKFYDFARAIILCPKCGVEFNPEKTLRGRRGRSPAVLDKEEATVDKVKKERTILPPDDDDDMMVTKDDDLIADPDPDAFDSDDIIPPSLPVENG